MQGEADDAAASAIAFVAAGLIFIAAMGTLVYIANNKVPPASEERASVDYHAEARYLMETYVWASGGNPYYPGGYNPSGGSDGLDLNTCTDPDTGMGTGDWEEGVVPPALPPTLGFLGSIGRLDERKVLTLAEAAPAGYPFAPCLTDPDGTYDYEQLRAAWGLTSDQLDFRLVIVRTDLPAADPLLEYGLDVPAGSPTTPAVSHLPMKRVNPSSADAPVRVTIHVFAR